MRARATALVRHLLGQRLQRALPAEWEPLLGPHGLAVRSLVSLADFGRCCDHLRVEAAGRPQLAAAETAHAAQALRVYHRAMATAAPGQPGGVAEEADFHRAADSTLDSLQEALEEFIEDLGVDGDIEYSQGVLTVKLGDLGTYVINKQTPNRQVWMSSPVSGPVRYDYHDGRWVYRRDGHFMHARLESELKALTGGELELDRCFGCEKLNVCTGDRECQPT